MGTNYSDTYIFDPVKQQPAHYAKPLMMIETVKDIFQLELYRYFTTQKEQGLLITEVPTIEKYKITDPTLGQDPFVSSINVIRQLPDIDQKLPIIAITAATGKTRPLGIGNQYVGVVQMPPRVQTKAGPWSIPVNGQVLFVTGVGQTIISFTSVYVANFAAMQPAELAAAINSQSTIIYATVQVDSSVLIQLVTPKSQSIAVQPVSLFNYTGTVGAPSDPSGYASVDDYQFSGISLGGSNADASSALGLVGQSDNINNPARPPMHRFQTAKNIILSCDIGADDDNQRTEITDLLFYFLELRMNYRNFAFLGDVTKGQNWQIMFERQATLNGESEIPRPEGDGFAKIYVNRVSIPLVIVDYVDRPAVFVNPVVYSDEISAAADRPLPGP
jgi:hypothetical protein